MIKNQLDCENFEIIYLKLYYYNKYSSINILNSINNLEMSFTEKEWEEIGFLLSNYNFLKVLIFFLKSSLEKGNNLNVLSIIERLGISNLGSEELNLGFLIISLCNTRQH